MSNIPVAGLAILNQFFVDLVHGGMAAPSSPGMKQMKKKAKGAWNDGIENAVASALYVLNALDSLLTTSIGGARIEDVVGVASSTKLFSSIIRTTTHARIQESFVALSKPVVVKFFKIQVWKYFLFLLRIPFKALRTREEKIIFCIIEDKLRSISSGERLRSRSLPSFSKKIGIGYQIASMNRICFGTSFFS